MTTEATASTKPAETTNHSAHDQTRPASTRQGDLLERAHMLVLSTAHMSLDTATNWIPLCPWACFEKADYGWFMYVCDDIDITETSHVPLEIRSAIHVAKREGCQWIMWDTDGPVIDELPEFEWAEASG